MREKFFAEMGVHFLKVFVGPRSILWGHWYPLFRTSDDSAHGFQSQGGFIACVLLLLAHQLSLTDACRFFSNAFKMNCANLVKMRTL